MFYSTYENTYSITHLLLVLSPRGLWNVLQSTHSVKHVAISLPLCRISQFLCYGIIRECLNFSIMVFTFCIIFYAPFTVLSRQLTQSPRMVVDAQFPQCDLSAIFIFRQCCTYAPRFRWSYFVLPCIEPNEIVPNSSICFHVNTCRVII